MRCAAGSARRSSGAACRRPAGPLFLPRAYEDRRRLVPINAAPGRTPFAGKVTRIQESFTGRRRMLRWCSATARLDSGHLVQVLAVDARPVPGRPALSAGEVRVFGGLGNRPSEMEPTTSMAPGRTREIVPTTGLDRRARRLLARAIADRFADQIVDPVRPRSAPRGPAAAGAGGAQRSRSGLRIRRRAGPAPARRRSPSTSSSSELGWRYGARRSRLPGIAFEAGPERLREALELLPFAPTAPSGAPWEIAGT